MNKIFNIAIVGAGQLGSRHLQSIKSIQVEANIFVVDPSGHSLNIAEERYNEVAENPKIGSVNFLNESKDLPKVIDLLILATSSQGRGSLVKTLLSEFDVKNVLLEKVLFQTEKEYDEVNSLLIEKNVKAWVNCPRRIFPVYRDLKEKLTELKGPIFGIVDGGDWSIGSNAIHYLDVFAYLINCQDYSITTNGLSKKILKSKREGYLEFHGTLTFNFTNGAVLIINSREDATILPSFLISTGTSQYLINELRKEVFITEIGNESETIHYSFEIPFQSQITSMVAKDILVNNACGLTNYKSSMQLHKPFIKGLIKFLKENYNQEINHCPIT